MVKNNQYNYWECEFMSCPNCGAQIEEYDDTCPVCGEVLHSTPQDAGDQGSSGNYVCQGCGEELEYITAYKQWYCYNCQNYVDLPPPTPGYSVALDDQGSNEGSVENDEPGLEPVTDDDSDVSGTLGINYYY